MRYVPRMIRNGLFAVLPISITLYGLYWLATKTESILGGPLKAHLGEYPKGYYIYGMGMAIGLVILFFVGMFLEFYMGRLFLRWSEWIVGHIPLVKTVYSSIKDLLDFIGQQGGHKENRTVAVEVSPGVRMIGYVTRDVWDDLHTVIAKPGDVAVFLPFSYAMGGYTIMLARDKITPLDMTFEEGYRFVLTAYMISPQEGNGKRPPLFRRDSTIMPKKPDNK